MPKVVMNIRYVFMKGINSVSDHERNRTPDGASAIDPARSHLNKVLLGPATQADALKELWENGVKPPATQSETPYIQLVLSASPEFFRDPGQGPGQWNHDRLKEWVKRTRKWLRDEYGRDCVHISMHLDEDTPHIHALIVPTYDKKPRKPGRQKRGETLEQFEARKREAENAATVRAVGRSSNEKWRKNFARHDARKSYHRAVDSLGIEYGEDFLAAGVASPTHKPTGTWVKEKAAEVVQASARVDALAEKTKTDRQAIAKTLKDDRDAFTAERDAARAEIAQDRAEVRGIRKTLNGLLDQAETFLRFPGIPAAVRKAGVALFAAAGRPISEPEAETSHGGGSSPTRRRIGLDKPIPVSVPAPQPAPEASSPDSGFSL